MAVMHDRMMRNSIDCVLDLALGLHINFADQKLQSRLEKRLHLDDTGRAWETRYVSDRIALVLDGNYRTRLSTNQVRAGPTVEQLGGNHGDGLYNASNRMHEPQHDLPNPASFGHVRHHPAACSYPFRTHILIARWTAVAREQDARHRKQPRLVPSLAIAFPPEFDSRIALG